MSLLSIAATKKLKFGKSAIHQWGVFADEIIQEGDFIIEYKGQIISNEEADRREKIYESENKSDYVLYNMFLDV